jgi:hypothetical protein
LSLLVTSLAVAGGILVGRALSRAWRRPESASKPSPNLQAPPKAAVDPLASFPCHLGDVILGNGEQEAWLSGALVFSEAAPTAALFIAPDAGGDRAILARPAPDASLVWMMPLRSGELPAFREPPSTLEHGQERFERRRRLPLRVSRVGTGAPDVGSEVIFAEYAAPMGERLILLIASQAVHAWRGRVLEEGTYDRLPGGADDPH